MASEVPLTKGLVAIVDDEDFGWLSQWKWRVAKGPYACRNPGTSQLPRPRIWMHRLIMGEPPDGMVLDHINGNSLDNRRSNLRFASRMQNAQNRRKGRGTSPYKGVCRRSAGGRFQALICVAGRQWSLGWADTDEEAARLYDAAARQHFGEFARLNFPDATVGGNAPQHSSESLWLPSLATPQHDKRQGEGC